MNDNPTKMMLSVLNDSRFPYRGFIVKRFDPCMESVKTHFYAFVPKSELLNAESWLEQAFFSSEALDYMSHSYWCVSEDQEDVVQTRFRSGQTVYQPEKAKAHFVNLDSWEDFSSQDVGALTIELATRGIQEEFIREAGLLNRSLLPPLSSMTGTALTSGYNEAVLTQSPAIAVAQLAGEFAGKSSRTSLGRSIIIVPVSLDPNQQFALAA